MNILHITEASAGGVLESIVDISKVQSDLGHNVHVSLIMRPESPSADEIRAKFDPRVSVQVVLPKNRVNGLLSIHRQISLALQNRVIVHAHSSWAGLASRLRFLPSAIWRKMFYSPHGWGFLRRDVPLAARAAFFVTEWLLSFRGTVICVSASERDALKRIRLLQHVIVIPNGIIIGDGYGQIPKPITLGKFPKVAVGSGGRLAPQKNPMAFAKIAAVLENDLDFCWLGGSSESSYRGVLLQAGVKHFPSLSRSQVAEKLAMLDIFVSCSGWEGMPLMLLEAQAAGLPTVVTKVAGNVDIVIDGVTGFICSTFEELQEKVRLLGADEHLRAAMSVNALNRSKLFSVEAQASALVEAYAGFRE